VFQRIRDINLLAMLLVIQPRKLVASLVARAHGCLLSNSLTTKTFPTGLLPTRQPQPLPLSG